MREELSANIFCMLLHDFLSGLLTMNLFSSQTKHHANSFFKKKLHKHQWKFNDLK